MLNTGFLRRYRKHPSTTKTKHMVSTMPAEVASIGKNTMKDPIEITVGKN
jgi:hypothetical protein